MNSRFDDNFFVCARRHHRSRGRDPKGSPSSLANMGSSSSSFLRTSTGFSTPFVEWILKVIVACDYDQPQTVL